MKQRAVIAGAAVLGLMLGVSGAAAESKDAPSSTPVGPSWSAEVAPDGSSSIALDPQQTKDIQAVSDYFNSLKTLQGKFIQTAADGKVMKGKFMMMRPGKFRFDYDRPSMQLIVSDGTYLAIQDRDVNTEDRVSLDQTPFRILLRDDVDLLRDARISEVQQIGESLLLALEDKSPDSAGRITLIMSRSSEELVLKEWITTDAQGLDTRIEIVDAVRDEQLDKAKFVIQSVGNPFKR